MCRRICKWLALLFCFSSVLCFAQSKINNGLAASFTKFYKHKILFLRHFYSADQIKYDLNGNLTGKSDEGFWTVDGLVQIKQIRMSDTRIEIECNRFSLKIENKKLDYDESSRSAVIVVEFGSQQLTEDVVNQLFSKIFLTAEDHFDAMLPNYWQPCITAAAKGIGGDSMLYCRFSEKFLAIPGVHLDQSSDPTQPVPHPTAERVGPQVTRPRSLYAPDPDFSIEASHAQVNGLIYVGMIVGADGTPSSVWIKKPLGYGLDELTVAKLQTWKFSPGLRDDKPVPVMLEIEVSFSSYRQ